MLRIIIILFVVSSSFGQTKYRKDLDVQKTNLDERRIYQPSVNTIQNDDDFILLVKKLFHMNGTTREDFSPKHYILDTQDQLQKAIAIIKESL
ncbi:hypothetical protein [uncultured Aquimarina sp.]|uniref:hypothetical protein n=1 Tax=uncultured Aquimarina sp. TaxID=575652 RepID=UPI0026030803|nr:hypothetical protein [uncultured Aquimarina sp.]